MLLQKQSPKHKLMFFYVFSNISYHPLFYLLKEPVTGQRQLIMKEIFIWRVA
jgi:hypothetical protein